MNEVTRRWHLTNSAGNHIVEVCQNDVSQAEGITQYLIEGLQNGEAIVVFAKPALRKTIILRMTALGIEVQAFKAQGQIKFFDAEFLISHMLINDIPKAQVFDEYVGAPIEISRLKFGKVRVFGGMVALLWSSGKYDTAMQLENCWVNLTKKQEFSLLCSYSLCNYDPSTYEKSLQFIYTCHKHLAPVEKYDSPELENEELLDILGIAWNRMIEKLADSSEASSQYPHHQ